MQYREKKGSMPKSHDARFLVAFSALLLFPIGYLSYLSPSIESLYTWSPVIVLAACVFYILYARIQMLIESASVIFLLMCMSLIVSSANNGSGSVIYAFQLICKYSSLFLLAFIIASDKNPERLCKALFAFFFSLTLANTVTVFLYPNSMYPDSRGWNICWLLGGDNFSVRYYILTVLFAALSQLRRKKLLVGASLINYALFVFVRSCGMGIISFLVVALLAFSPIKRMIIGKIKMWHVVAIGVCAFFVIVVLGQMEFFSFIIDALGKDATLSSRTRIWASTFELLSDHFVLGYGAVRGPEIQLLLMFPGMTNVHNTYLMLAMYGGVVLVGLFLMLQICSSRSFDALPCSELTHSLIICCIALVLHSQIEGNYIEIEIMIFALAYYLGKRTKAGIIDERKPYAKLGKSRR